MPGYQYFLLGLVSEPDRYHWLKVINSVHPPSDEMITGNLENYYYRVQLPAIRHSVPLPSDSLCWTSIAYVVWDDIDPGLLSSEQQVALLDWLHWGGQLIISGPKTLDLLAHSFLAPYLPATAGRPLKLDAAALAALNDYWTIPGDTSRPLAATNPWSAVGLEKRAEAEFLPGSGELVAERRVGRGRIVATAFRLVERELIQWPSFDSFFNGGLLNRPRRTYSLVEAETPQLDWADFPRPPVRSRTGLRAALFYARPEPAQSSAPAQRHPGRGSGGDPDDPNANIAKSNSIAANPLAAIAGQPDPTATDEQQRQKAQGDSGVGGWNDFGPVASEARRALKQAAGITIPQRQFVLKVLLGYLIVLVPLNWALFWLLGRIEWAWIAAPLISVVCAGMVIWLAQLDIGFARSSTEIAVVEIQGGYHRAHVTRYTALYTSLSTTYEVNLEQPSALALPFATNPQFELLSGQQRSTVDFRRDSQAHLTGYTVSSNATGMIHSEHMAELAGSLTLVDDQPGGMRVVNGTRLSLRGAGVVRRRAEGPGSDIAWIGGLNSGDAAQLKFKPADDALFANERERAAALSPRSSGRYAQRASADRSGGKS